MPFLYESTNSIFWCTHLQTSSLSIIFLSIQSKISGNRKVIAVFPRSNVNFVRFDIPHTFDALTFILHQSHSLFCWFNRTSLVTERWDHFFPQLNVNFIQFDIFHIFDALTFYTRLGSAQDVHFLYMGSHLSALHSCTLIFSTNFQFIFTFKYCTT